MASVKKIEQVLGSKDEKLHSVEYNEEKKDGQPVNSNAGLQSVYIRKGALANLGNPDKVKITIEAA